MSKADTHTLIVWNQFAEWLELYLVPDREITERHRSLLKQAHGKIINSERWYTRGNAVETNAEANERILALVATRDAELARLERRVQEAMLAVTRYLEWRRTESDGHGGAKR